MIETRNVAELVLDFSLYPRNEISDATVGLLRDAYQAGASLPPVVIDGASSRIVDGFHRVKMYQSNGVDSVECDVRFYATELDLYIDAVKLNRGHGRAFDRYDINRIALRLQQWGITRELVSEIIRIPVAQIERIRVAETKTGHNVIPLKTGLSHLQDRVLTKRQQGAVERYGGQQATFYARQILSLLENDIYPTTPAFVESMNALTETWLRLREKVQTGIAQ